MALLALMLCSGPAVAAESTVGGLCEETSCEADSTLRVIEYFGADWCEPCRSVEAMLDGLDRSDVLVIRHTPSPQDGDFSNRSYQRFDGHYGLISLPAIVIDGYAVLTGETMTLRLEEALNVTVDGRTNLSENVTTWVQPCSRPTSPGCTRRQRQFHPPRLHQRHVDGRVARPVAAAPAPSRTSRSRHARAGGQ